MKRMILLVATILVATGAALAHGNQQHVMGTVTALTENSVTVQTTAKEPVTVYTMPDTKYVNKASRYWSRTFSRMPGIGIDDAFPNESDRNQNG